MLSNKLLETCLNEAGYYQCPTTPGLWRHKWRPILFCLIVDDFGIEYSDKRHANHLRNTLLKHYKITQDCTGSRFAGIDLAWDYSKRTCRLSIKNYIKNLLLKWVHTIPSKPQHAPFRHAPIIYGAKQQFTHSPDTSPPLDAAGVKRIQAIIGALLYYWARSRQQAPHSTQRPSIHSSLCHRAHQGGPQSTPRLTLHLTRTKYSKERRVATSTR